MVFSILLFNWTHYGKYVTILTLITWAVFFFYDYFIGNTARDKASILDNPIPKIPKPDHRTQIMTKQVEYDGMLSQAGEKI